MNYLLTGPEEYLKEQFIERLKKSLFTDGKSSFDFDAFHAADSDVSAVLDSLNTMPFMSKQRLVLIRDAEEFSSQGKEQILKYLKKPARFVTLVLETSSREPDKFLTAASKLAKTERCGRLRFAELDGWIQKEFEKRKKKISPQCARFIRESAENDLAALKNEIEKIFLFAGDAEWISRGHIEAVLGGPLYRKIFELTDAVLSKKPGKALDFIEKLLVREKPHQALNLLAWQFRNIIKVKLLGRVSEEELSRRLNIDRRFAGKLVERSGRFTLQGLERNLEAILEGDVCIKTGKIDGRHALERVVIRLCG